MFISDHLVYLELHKTGCSHIRRIFNDALEGEIVSKHNQATDDLFTEGRVFVGSIRNPWSWYVSLWGYGCDGKGNLRDRLTRSGLRRLGWRSAPSSALAKLLKRHPDNSQAWLATYRDANDPAAFRDWLHMLHDDAYMPDIGEGYSDSALRRVAGLMTYRYLKFFSIKAGEEGRLNGLSTQSQIRAWDAEQTFVDAFIRNESLEADIFRVLEQHDMALTEQARANILALPKTNVSSRKRASVNYYDPGTVALVAQREQLIVDKFAYMAPELF
ncbi:MAG: hypothetical protein AAF986_05000 [Pseudomonadota bacterium]